MVGVVRKANLNSIRCRVVFSCDCRESNVPTRRRDPLAGVSSQVAAAELRTVSPPGIKVHEEAITGGTVGVRLDANVVVAADIKTGKANGDGGRCVEYFGKEHLTAIVVD